MSSNEKAISAKNISKCYQIYRRPQDRLVQSIAPRIQKLFLMRPKQYYKEFWALRNLSLQVGKGETVGIVGRNGSGKSTLLQIICGTLAPTSGSVTTQGTVAALLELGTGFSPHFTGIENVYLYGQVLGMTHAHIDKILPDILEFADIGDHVKEPVQTYSSGMLMRLAFAISVSRNPDILVVDEALAVGDAAFSRKCFARIEAMRENGTTILFVSHAANMIVELCDRAVLIDDGQLIYDGESKKTVALYHKLLFAPVDKRVKVRQEIILAMNRCDSERLQSVSDETKNKPQVELKSFFAASLVSQSRVEYECQGAQIEDPHIETTNGRRVNVLVHQQEYVYHYRVRFSQQARQVKFGMLIKTVSGLELGGCAYPGVYKSIELIEKGSLYIVKFTFKCLLNAGTYFLNAGVIGDVDINPTYLHRIIDAVMFNVQPIHDHNITGMVNFNITQTANNIMA